MDKFVCPNTEKSHVFFLKITCLISPLVCILTVFNSIINKHDQTVRGIKNVQQFLMNFSMV